MDPRSNPDDSQVDPVARGSLRQQVTIRILTSVFEGRFQAGQHLVVQRLADLYRVSPTPIREALVELAAFGIVDLLPNRGAIVLPFGPPQVREISQIRRVLEVEAARSACGRIDSGQLAALEGEMSRLQDTPVDHRWDRDARAADTRLHGLIAGSCGSTRLASEIDRYLLLFRSLRDVSHLRDAWTNYSRSNDVPEHMMILQALGAGRAGEAARALDRHIRSAAKTLEEVLFAERSAPVPCAEGSPSS